MSLRDKVLSSIAGAAALSAAVLVPVAVGDQHDDGARPHVIIADGRDAVPSRTLEDWVSYGDHTVIVNVASETEIPATAEEVTAGEGYIGRTVNMQIDQTVWSRTGAPALPSTITMAVDGWSFQGQTRTPIAREEGSRLEPGHTYILSLALLADGSWTAAGSGAALPYDGSVVGAGEFRGMTMNQAEFSAAIDEEGTSAAEGVAGTDVMGDPVYLVAEGKTSQQVGDMLTTTDPDPVAEANFNLDPVQRFEVVSGNQEPAETFCSLALPLDISEASHLTSTEMGGILETLRAKESGTDADDLAVLAAYFNGDESLKTQADSVRPAVVMNVEGQCGIEVGDLQPNATEPPE